MLRFYSEEEIFAQDAEERKLRHQMSSGFGTQHNDSRDEPNYGGESIELRTICPTNSTETDPEAPLLQRTDSEQDSDAYMAYQKSLLARSPSYRKSVDRLSLLSSISSDDDEVAYEMSPEGTVKKLSDPNESNRVFNTSARNMHDPRPPMPCEEEFFRKCTTHRKQSPRNILRGVSDQSITTLSTDQDEFITRQSNLRDELLNCEKKELFQFLSEDFDTSNNYFSDTVGYSNAILDADTDSLVLDASLADRSREEYHPVPNATPPRKTSSSSIRSNFSYISNSIFAALEQRRGGSISESIDRMLTRSVSHNRVNSDMEDREPLVSDSEFENIIASFEKELHEIKKSTPSLHRNLSISSEERSDNKFNTSIALVSPRKEHRRSSSNTYVPADQDVILARRAHTLGYASANRESVQLKRRSLEKQSNIDDGFSVSNEIRKICDHMHAPFNADRLSGKPISPNGVSPNMRRKTEFHNSFDRIKRTSLIERVDEATDEDTMDRQPDRVVSEKLPRKMLSVELKLDSISLKSTGSYENLISTRDPRQYHTKQLDKFPDRVIEPPPQQGKKSSSKSPKKSPKKGIVSIKCM